MSPYNSQTFDPSQQQQQQPYPRQQHRQQHHAPARQYSHHQQQYQHVPVSGPRTKCDQVIFEAMCKACEAIVGARTAAATATTTSANNNSRFNLQIPPVAAIRSILQQNRLQLRVAPLRMDVYYQHPTTAANNTSNGPSSPEKQPQRELLERWCFDYSPSPPEAFLQAEGLVVTSSDPMAQLTHVCKRIVVWLRVLYCRSRLLPAQSTATSSSNIGFSVYVHTDMNTDDVGELLSQTHSSFRLLQPRGATVTTPYGTLHWKVAYTTNVPQQQRRSVRLRTPSQSIPLRTPTQQQHQPLAAATIAHSAPVVQQQQRPLSFAERSRQQHLQQQEQATTSTYGKTLDPSQLFLRNRQQRSASPSRRNTITDDGDGRPTMAPAGTSKVPQEKPERVLSALSLALLQAGTEDDAAPLNHTASPQQRNGMSNSDEEGVLVEQEPFRRAALHEVPAHWRTARPDTGYGVAYNHSIPWQKLSPATAVPNTSSQQQQQQQQPMAGTPPTAAFLGSSPGAFLGTPVSKSNNNNTSTATMTPPFVRPVGFLSDASVQTATASSVRKAPMATATTTPTLDSLRHSPFELHQPLGPDTELPHHEEAIRGDSMTTSMLSHHHHHPDIPSGSSTMMVPDLPFAIEAPTSDTSLLASLQSSRLLASTTTAASTTVDELQQQLQEFQAFGASLMVDASSGATADRSTATTTG